MEEYQKKNMKLIEFKEYNNTAKNELNKRKVAVAIAIAAIIFIVFVLSMIYAHPPNF